MNVQIWIQIAAAVLGAVAIVILAYDCVKFYKLMMEGENEKESSDRLVHNLMAAMTEQYRDFEKERERTDKERGLLWRKNEELQTECEIRGKRLDRMVAEIQKMQEELEEEEVLAQTMGKLDWKDVKGWMQGDEKTRDPSSAAETAPSPEGR
jgi:hypothetical protein